MQTVEVDSSSDLMLKRAKPAKAPESATLSSTHALSTSLALVLLPAPTLPQSQELFRGSCTCAPAFGTRCHWFARLALFGCERKQNDWPSRTRERYSGYSGVSLLIIFEAF